MFHARSQPIIALHIYKKLKYKNQTFHPSSYENCIAISAFSLAEQRWKVVDSLPVQRTGPCSSHESSIQPSRVNILSQWNALVVFSSHFCKVASLLCSLLLRRYAVKIVYLFVCRGFICKSSKFYSPLSSLGYEANCDADLRLTYRSESKDYGLFYMQFIVKKKLQKEEKKEQKLIGFSGSHAKLHFINFITMERYLYASILLSTPSSSS